MEPRIGELGALDAAADQGAAQAERLHRVLQLPGGELGMLQGDARQRREAVGVAGDHLGQCLVLQPDDLAGEVGVRAVPEGVDAEHLIPWSSIAARRAGIWSSSAFSTCGRPGWWWAG